MFATGKSSDMEAQTFSLVACKTMTTWIVGLSCLEYELACLVRVGLVFKAHLFRYDLAAVVCSWKILYS